MFTSLSFLCGHAVQVIDDRAVAKRTSAEFRSPAWITRLGALQPIS
jgi:hypothetical protein